MTYTQAFLLDLSDGQWHCGSEWLARFMPTYAQRLSEVDAEARAAEGEDRIESRPCKRHAHKGGLFEYRDKWAKRPQQLALGAA